MKSYPFCVAWLNSTSEHCSRSQKVTSLVESSLFLLLLIVVSALFIICTVKRWYTLRESFNVFTSMSISIHFWLPLHFTYYFLNIIQITTNNSRIPLYVISFCQWFGYTVLGISFGPLIAVWINSKYIHKKFRTRRSTKWPLPLILLVSAFASITFVSSICMGFPKLYEIAARVYFATWTVYLWLCSLILVSGAYDLYFYMDHSIDKTTRVDLAVRRRQSDQTIVSRKSMTDHTRNHIKKVLIGVVGCLFIPASIGTLIHSSILTLVDKSAWASGTVLALYRCCATTYVLFWTDVFWKELTRKLSESTNLSTSNSDKTPSLSSAKAITTEGN